MVDWACSHMIPGTWGLGIHAESRGVRLPNIFGLGGGGVNLILIYSNMKNIW